MVTAKFKVLFILKHYLNYITKIISRNKYFPIEPWTQVSKFQSRSTEKNYQKIQSKKLLINWGPRREIGPGMEMDPNSVWYSQNTHGTIIAHWKKAYFIDEETGPGRYGGDTSGSDLDSLGFQFLLR